MAKKKAAKKSKVCVTCGTLKKVGMMTKEGLKFCDTACHKKFVSKKGVCEFC